MIRSKTLQKNTQISGINITPFTDICLVLLIIFMVTANTFVQENSVDISLPKAASASESLPKSVTVHIARGERFFVNDKPVECDSLQACLKQKYDEENMRLLVVRADEKVPYDSVMYAIDSARQVGIVDIALATRQSEGTATQP